MKEFHWKIENWLFVLPLLFVTIVKIPHLSIPYFWDEAWSYFPAVYKMYENGPGLLPGALPLWDAKGHPLFFFFVSSVWMRTVGTSVMAVHILPFLISIGTLTALFYTVKKHVNVKTANVAVLLFSVQSLFLAQATMLLPEMLLTFFLLLCVNSFLSEKLHWFALWATLMVMTKETSIVFVGGFFIFHLATNLKPGKEAGKYIRNKFFLVFPLLMYGVFLILHKIEFGTFLFPDHTGYIQLSFDVILNKIQIATGMIFTRYGRNIILAATILALLVSVLKKKKIENKKLVFLLVLQIFLFLLFSAVNFYTQRYMLSLLGLFIIIASSLIVQARFKNALLNLLVLVLITGLPLYYSFTKKSVADSDLGYVQVVKVHQQMVNYCEEQKWHDKPVAASFNLIFCLRNPHLGYVSSENGFSNVMNLGQFRNAEIFLNECTSFGMQAQLDSIKIENQLVKEFRLEHAWGEIFKKPELKY